MFAQRIKEYILENGMVAPGDRVLAGVSGGADSVCLLLVLAELAQCLAITLEVVHVEHGIRGEESRGDAAFVGELCRRMGIPVRIRSVDVPEYAHRNRLGTEEAARELRYGIIEEEAQSCGAARIALAHHMEDNAETVLFHLIRGSGLAGLQGIAPVRDWRGAALIRPLLCVRRSEIEAYLGARGQDYRQDSTNADVRYARNRIRQIVFPELEKLNARAVDHINESAGRLAEVWDYLRQQANDAKRQLVVTEGGKVTVDIPKLRKLHPVLQEQVVLDAIGLTAGYGKDITSVHVAQVLDLTEGCSGRRVSLPYRVVAEREFDRLVLTRGGERTEWGGEQPASVNGAAAAGEIVLERNELERIREGGGRETVALPGGAVLAIEIADFDGNFQKIPKKRYTKWLDYDKIIGKLTIRHRRPGDYLVIKGGHHKKLKQALIEDRVPAGRRGELWLLAEGECVLWAVGSRISEDYKLTADTSRVIAVTYCDGQSFAVCGADTWPDLPVC